MKVFEQELKDGLGDLIKSNSIACLGKARPNSIIQYAPSEIEKFASRANANPGQFDLYYLDSVLVSTGWNLNDDVFDNEETWNARNTCVDKQFNYMHDETDIIGHMTSASVMVGDKIYEGEDIPEEFHIIEGSVLYRVWNDEKLKARMDTLISEIEEEKWYVSMECLFSNFDYAMIAPDGAESVVKRTKTTAYLSRHLRAYGGKGVYEGYKVGRLLRNITFSGKGLVNEPANPNSIIFNGEDVKSLTKSFRAYTTVASKQWEKNMNEEALKAQVAELSKQVEELKATNKTLASEMSAKAEKENAEKVKLLNDQIADLGGKIKASETILTEKEQAIAESVKKVEEAQAKLDEALKEVETLKASIKKAERVAELTKAGVETEKHEDLITKFANVSDDIFKEFVELHAAKKEDKKKEDNKDEKKLPPWLKDKASLKDAEEALEAAKAEKDAPVAPTEVEDNKTQEVRTKTAAWLQNTFKTTAGRNIRKTSQASDAK